jgi:hypothetical protein
VISFGRPGVWLLFSDDGAGRHWGSRHTLVEPDPAGNTAATCGYTSMEPLDDQRFLVAHTIFRYPDPAGVRKAVVVREVQISPTRRS